MNVTDVRMPDGTVAALDSDRTIAGLILPFNKPGETSAGLYHFTPGAVTWPEDVSRVKLLREHDKNTVIGYATHIEETPAGIFARFTVPPTWAGDDALNEVAYKLRDAFSPGIRLAPAAQLRKQSQPGSDARGEGVLREVSLVAVPAWDDTQATRSSS